MTCLDDRLLESMADTLVGLLGERSLTESSMRARERRIARNNRRLRRRLAACVADIQPALSITMGLASAVMQGARLTAPQREVLALYLCGLSYAEIGAVRGTSRQSAHQSLGDAVRGLRAYLQNEPSMGADEVYRSLVARGRRP